jgi:hypothetical protein
MQEGYQQSLGHLNEALSFIASEQVWYAVQRDRGVGWKRVQRQVEVWRGRKRLNAMPMETTTKGGEEEGKDEKDRGRGLPVLVVPARFQAVQHTRAPLHHLRIYPWPAALRPHHHHPHHQSSPFLLNLQHTEATHAHPLHSPTPQLPLCTR